MTSTDPNRRRLLSAAAAALLLPGNARSEKEGATGSDGRWLLDTFAAAPGSPIPADVNMVQTAGYSVRERGSARYVFDPTIDEAYVRALPRSAFRSRDGRGFRLATDQEITPFMFGAVGAPSFDLQRTDFTKIADDTAALKAFFAFCTTSDLPSVNWGGVFGLSQNLVLGNITAGSQESFAGTETYHGSMVLVVKSQISGAVLTIRNRRLCSYEALSVVGPGGESRNWSKRLFDVGLHLEDQAQMQVFTTLFVNHARLCGFYNSGRGSSGDNVFQNRVLNAYFSLCGSGLGSSLGAPQGWQTATYSARFDSGGGTEPGQRTRYKVSALPPVFVDSFTADGSKFLPMFAVVGTQIYEVKDIDRIAGTITLYPWVDLTAPPRGALKYVYGGGLITVDGDAGMLDAKVASTGCAIGIQNLATYGGTFQLTAQHCAIGFAQGKSRENISLGAVLNLYAEGNDVDFVYNSHGSFTLAAEQALDISKVVFFNPRRSDNSVAEHLKPGGLLMNLGGAWHRVEVAEDIDLGLYSATIAFTEPAARIVPLRGDNAVVRIANPLLPDEKTPAAPHFKRLFGYRARLVEVTGTGAGGAPSGEITIMPYPGLKLNGGAPGAPAKLRGFAGPVRVRLELDPSDSANCIVTIVCGGGAGNDERSR